MICVITGKETKDKTKNIPLHRDGRAKLDEIHEDFNIKLQDEFVRRHLDPDGGVSHEGMLRDLAPRFTKARVLRVIDKMGVQGLYDTIKPKQELETEDEQ